MNAVSTLTIATKMEFVKMSKVLTSVNVILDIMEMGNSVKVNILEYCYNR